jgi:hypothetical protein
MRESHDEPRFALIRPASAGQLLPQGEARRVDDTAAKKPGREAGFFM